MSAEAREDLRCYQACSEDGCRLFGWSVGNLGQEAKETKVALLTMATTMTQSSFFFYVFILHRTHTRRRVETRARATKAQQMARMAQPWLTSPLSGGEYVSAFMMAALSKAWEVAWSFAIGIDRIALLQGCRLTAS